MVGNKLGTPEAIGGSWEGMVYTRVFLSDLRERLGAQGFDGDAYVADWESDLEAILGDGPPRDVATQPLEPLAVAAGHGRARVHVDSTNFGERVVRFATSRTACASLRVCCPGASPNSCRSAVEAP